MTQKPTVMEFDALLRQDFLAFVGKSFATLNPGRTLRYNWHHEAIAHHLGEVMAGRCRRLIINLPPRYLKSIMASVAFPAFVLGHDPTKRIICASYAQDLAAKLSRDCRSLMGTSWYQRVFPDSPLDPARKAECNFETLAHGGRIATSVGGVLTGLGGDIIIIDDPLKSGDALSEKAREGCIEWFNNTVSSRLDDKQTGAIIVIMQRLHVDDLTGHLLRAKGWEVVTVPAFAEKDCAYILGKGRVYHRKQGELLQPEYESEADLQQLKRTMGSLSFEAQYQQNPMPAEGAQVKRDWFCYYSRAPNRVVGGPLYQSWDTASTSKEFSDWSVGTTWYIDENKYYLLDVCRVRLTYPELRQQIVNYAHKWKCRRVLIEEKGSGQSLIQEFEQSGQIPVIPYQPKGDKIMRLAAVTPLIEAGQVLFPQNAEWRDEFEAELLQFPNGRHDDQVDSLSQFLNYKEQEKFNCIRIVPFGRGS